jgi:hypothetical protein
MTRSRRVVRFLTLGAAAMAGLVGAHVVDYLILVPNGAARHRVLVQTGHGYFGEAAVLAFAAGVIAMLAVASLGYRRGRDRASEAGSIGLTHVARRLAALQVAGFLLMEVTERLAAGAPLSHLVDPYVVTGVLIQVVVAVLAAAILVGIQRTAEMVGRVLGRRPVTRSAGTGLRPIPRRLGPVVRAVARPGVVRGPPPAVVFPA